MENDLKNSYHSSWADLTVSVLTAYNSRELTNGKSGFAQLGH